MQWQVSDTDATKWNPAIIFFFNHALSLSPGLHMSVDYLFTLLKNQLGI